MSRAMKAMMFSALLAGCAVLANPASQEAQANRRPYWNNYWNWYNGTYSPYYRYQYNYGPGHYNYTYRYGPGTYTYGYPYSSNYYYRTRPQWGIQLGPLGIRSWY